MRRIIATLSEIRRLQLRKRNAPVTMLAEVDQKFRWFDQQLNLITPTSTGTSLEEVMTSADFTFAIQEFVQRQMMPGYQERGFQFEPLIRPETVPNFLPVTRYQDQNSLDELEYVGEKGATREDHRKDATKRQWRVYRWERGFDFSMEALINDDLGYFNDQAAKMGRAARRSLEKFVSRMIWNATTTGRLIGLGALYSTTGRLTTARISAARMAFNQRTDATGNPINAALRYIIHHAGLVDTVAQIQASQLVPELATNAANVIRGTFTPIEDPFAPGAAPDLPWMALGDYRQNGIVPFVLVRRQGMPGPLLLRKRTDIEQVTSLLGAGTAVPPIMGDYHSGNVQIKIVDTWGTYIDPVEGNLVDYRGAYYSSGTAA